MGVTTDLIHQAQARYFEPVYCNEGYKTCRSTDLCLVIKYDIGYKDVYVKIISLQLVFGKYSS